jgi:hypothetical protein
MRPSPLIATLVILSPWFARSRRRQKVSDAGRRRAWRTPTARVVGRRERQWSLPSYVAPGRDVLRASIGSPPHGTDARGRVVILGVVRRYLPTDGAGYVREVAQRAFGRERCAFRRQESPPRWACSAVVAGRTIEVASGDSPAVPLVLRVRYRTPRKPHGVTRSAAWPPSG